MWALNLFSGELTYAWSTTGGLRAGTPQASVGASFGATVITGMSQNRQGLIGAAQFTAIDVSTPLAEVGGTGTWTQAYSSLDTNGNGEFDMVDSDGLSEPLTGPFYDPVFNRTVDALSVNVAAGANFLPASPIDAGVSHGIADTNHVVTVNIYESVKSLLRTSLSTISQ
jgi:hypothetical protein